jgi:hypothetical protein
MVKLYRYEDRDFAEGEVMPPFGDHYRRLTPEQKIVENKLIEALPDGENLRNSSLYTWEDEAVARRVFDAQVSAKKPRTYLYEVEVEAEKVRFRGDLNSYSAAVDAVANNQSPDAAIAWLGRSKIALRGSMRKATQMDPKTFSDMMEQQRQFYAKLQQTLAPHSEWMAKLAQQMPTLDPSVLENLQKSKAAMEAAMAEHVKNIQAYEESLKPQMQVLRS